MRAAVWFALACTAVGLLAGFLHKDRCIGSVIRPSERPSAQYAELCYTDVHILWFHRGWKHEPIPYINGDGELENNLDPDDATASLMGAAQRGVDPQPVPGQRLTEIGDLEYPLGSGLLVAVAALVTSTPIAFFLVSAGMLAMFGLASSALLATIASDRRRLLYFAIAPSMVLYAFHNWDLAAVACACASLAAFHRRADRAAGIFAGLGAASKIFPGLLVPVLAFARWREDRARAKSLFFSSIAAFAAINIPFIIANPRGWWFPWKFQSTRLPNTDSTWWMVARHFFFDNIDAFTRASSIISILLFVAGAVFLLVREARRDVFRPYVMSFAFVVLFLMTGKVFSPQYALWLLPFFVLLNVPWYGFAAFAITEAAVWIGIASYYLSGSVSDFRLNVTEIAIWGRFAALGWLLWWAIARGRELVVGVDVRRTTGIA